MSCHAQGKTSEAQYMLKELGSKFGQNSILLNLNAACAIAYVSCAVWMHA